MNARVDSIRLRRLSTIRADITARLRKTNQGMPSEIFDALVAQMAILQEKYEQRTVAER